MKANSSLEQFLQRASGEIKKYTSIENIFQLLLEFLLAQYDSRILSFRKREKRRSVKVKKILPQIPPGTYRTLKSKILRKPFLFACRNFFLERGNAKLEVEWRIIGFGIKVGNSTHITKILPEEGTEDCVYSDPNVKRAIDSHLREDKGNQLVFVHNHPGGIRRLIKNFVIGELPTASAYDRDRAWKSLGDNLCERLLQIRNRRLLFYLCENSQIREYYPLPGDLTKLTLKYLIGIFNSKNSEY